MFHVYPLSYNHYFVGGNTGAYTPINMAKLGSWLVPWESGRPTLSRDCDFWIPPSWTYGGTYGCPQDTWHSVGMLHAVGMYVVAISCVRLFKSRSSCIRRPDLNLSPWYLQLWPSAELAAGSRSKWAVVKSLLQICLWGLSNVKENIHILFLSCFETTLSLQKDEFCRIISDISVCQGFNYTVIFTGYKGIFSNSEFVFMVGKFTNTVLCRGCFENWTQRS